MIGGHARVIAANANNFRGSFDRRHRRYASPEEHHVEKFPRAGRRRLYHGTGESAIVLG